MAQRTVEITERREVPWLSVVFGYGPMLPLVAGAAGAWLTVGALRAGIVTVTLVYAGSILAFLAGVRRGLSFRTEGGPQLAQIAAVLSFYTLALIDLVALPFGARFLPAVSVTLGFLLVAVLDPAAAEQGQAPLFFARLRPAQISLAVVSLVILAVSIWFA